LNTLGSIYQALFISLFTMASRPMSHFDHPNKEMSVMRYPTVVIGQSRHLQQLAISLWMFSALLIPFIAWNVYGSYTAGNRTVQMSKKSMRKITVKGDIILVRYRFLLYRFRPAKWWWGNLLMMRQLLLAFAPAFDSSEPHTQVIFVSTVLVIYAAWTSQAKPWKSVVLNNIDVHVSVSLAIFMITSTALLESAAQKSRYTAIMIIMLFSALASLVFGLLGPISVMIRNRDDWSDCGCCAAPLEDWNVLGLGTNRPPETIAAVWMELVRKCAEVDEEGMKDLILRMPYYDRLDLVESISAWHALVPDVFPRAVPPQRRLVGLDHSISEAHGATTQQVVSDVLRFMRPKSTSHHTTPSGSASVDDFQRDSSCAKGKEYPASPAPPPIAEKDELEVSSADHGDLEVPGQFPCEPATSA